MKFRYTNYPDGRHELHFESSADSLGLEKEFIDNVTMACVMDKSESQIVLNCDATFKVSFDCDRCSSNYTEQQNTSFSLIKVFNEENYDPDDVNSSFIPSEITEIDLTDDVKEFLFLAIPMKKLCDEECKGLCTHCGINLNVKECDCAENVVNPQWNELLKLKDKLN